MIALHYNTKSRPPAAGVRGTEICIPNNFALDITGTVNILGKSTAAAGTNVAGMPVGNAAANASMAVQSSEARGAAQAATAAAIASNRTTNAVYNVAKPFERVRHLGKQNEMYAKSCFVIHERTTR